MMNQKEQCGVSDSVVETDNCLFTRVASRNVSRWQKMNSGDDSFVGVYIFVQLVKITGASFFVL